MGDPPPVQRPASSEALQQVVKKRTPPASTTTIADPGTLVTGQSASYEITVAPATAGPVPTGSVELTDPRRHRDLDGAGQVRSNAGGAATGHVQIYVDGRPTKLLKLSSNGKYRTYTITDSVSITRS